MENASRFGKLRSRGCNSIILNPRTSPVGWYYAPIIDYDGESRPNPFDSFVDMGAQESDFLIGIVNDNSDYVPNTFSLKQNYPNPFNPSTTIEFTLPKSEFVELKVYNILGKEVSTLISMKLNQGNHTYTFNGNNLASGIYYYRIKAGNFVETRKMIYLK